MGKLWYNKPAQNWDEALPLGNGRLGAMVYGEPFCDRFQINEETLWSGYSGIESRKHTMDEMLKIRELVRRKEYDKADELASDTMFNADTQNYLSFGDIFAEISFEKVDIRARNGLGFQNNITEYRRELDMNRGIVVTHFKCENGFDITKECFVSVRDDVLVMNIHAENNWGFWLKVSAAPQLETSFSCNENSVEILGRCPNVTGWKISKYDNSRESINFCTRFRVFGSDNCFTTGGSYWSHGSNLTLVFSLRTSFNGFDKMPVSEGREYVNATLLDLDNAQKLGYEQLRSRHVEEYKKYYDRVEISIDGECHENEPTDERIVKAGEGRVDNGLVVDLFDFGRYLTIAGNLCGTQPTNLQGIWSYHILPPWHCNYTMNINTEMNYWPTETVNLPECHMPLMTMLKELSSKGNILGLGGWCSWHNSDLWRFNVEASKGPMWGFWPMGGFWCCRHIWEHYIHTNDVDFLHEMYPVMTGAVDFLCDWMYENENGKLVTCPSTSPENNFVYNGRECAVCEGSAMDVAIIRDLLEKTAKASEILGFDSTRFTDMLSKIEDVKIGEDGRILEWGTKLEESEPGHRHVSHLYFLYPSDILETEEYKEAARKTLDYRMSHGGGHTGWSNAWIAALYARLGDGEKAAGHIKNMFANSIYYNMFDAHPPFQIDGNYGITAAICEMLVQSHTGEVKPLSAIPEAWKKGGFVHGFKTRQGKTLNFSWKDGKVESFELVD